MHASELLRFGTRGYGRNDNILVRSNLPEHTVAIRWMENITVARSEVVYFRFGSPSYVHAIAREKRGEETEREREGGKKGLYQSATKARRRKWRTQGFSMSSEFIRDCVHAIYSAVFLLISQLLVYSGLKFHDRSSATAVSTSC